MPAANENEEFEFRLRAEREKTAPAKPAGDPFAQARAEGVPVPDAPAPPAPPEPEKPLLTRALDPAAHALEAGTRAAGGTLGGLAGGLGGGLSWLVDRFSKTQSGATAGSGFDRGAEAANDMISKVMGQASPEAIDLLERAANLPELQALPGLGPELQALAQGARGAGTAAKMAGQGIKQVAADTKAGVAPALARVSGKEAAQTAEQLRVGAVDLSSTKSAQAQAAADAARKAGMSPEQAEAATQAADNHLADVERVGKAMDDAMLAQPRMSKDQMGGMLRAAAKTLHEKLSAKRMEMSGYSEALQVDGAKVVPTQPVLDVIKGHESGVANPNIRSALETIKGELKPEGLPLKSADSLRKYLDGIIETKQIRAANGALAADKETLSVVRDIRKAVTESMDGASSALKQARAKWAELSRGDLDRLEGKGDLKPVLAEDSLSGAYKMTEAQVAGDIIRKANAGSDSLGALVKTQPELKDAARLYYANELFGKELAPTPGQLMTFLKTNERSLKQSGLYDEFKTLANAKRARVQAVDEARGQAREAGQEVRAAAARGRTAKAQQDVADKFNTFRTEVETSAPKDVPAKVKSLGKSLVQEGLITQDEYAGLIRDADAASSSMQSSADARKLLGRVAVGLGMAAGGVEVGKSVLAGH